MKKKRTLLVLITGLMAFGCSNHNQDGLDALSEHQQVTWNKKLTQVIIEDIFTPPVSSRIYAYANIAAYEALIHADSDYKSLSGKLRELPPVPEPDKNQDYYWPLVASIAFSTTSQGLVYGQEKMMAYESAYLDTLKEIGIKRNLFANSVEYGRQIGKHILAWSAKDGYLERTAKTRYVLSEDPGAWKPTPPDYMPGIEPHWNTIRPFVIDSAGQFNPGPPTRFDSLKDSKFYQETLEVYNAVNNLDDEKVEIAKFWDCNPNISYTKGHLTFFDQKISPGGHWVSIAGIASQKNNLDLLEESKVLAYVSLTIADAFISCWDEKYRSSLIRPETYINKYIDLDWKPVLQTPAFPEYTSGHSVASASAATMLTSLLGDNFSFVDSTEMDFGLPARTFDSFFQASNEAAISRLYGGIHYMPAITNGVLQGKAVGNYIVGKLVSSESKTNVTQLKN